MNFKPCIQEHPQALIGFLVLFSALVMRIGQATDTFHMTDTLALEMACGHCAEQGCQCNSRCENHRPSQVAGTNRAKNINGS